MQLTVTKGAQILQKRQLLFEGSSHLADNVHYFIGRSPECHLVIDDHRVSRNHAQLSFINNSWSLKKTTNSGEMFLNGCPIQEEQVKDGDIIQVADYYISVVFEQKDIEHLEKVEKESAPVLEEEEPIAEETKELQEELEMDSNQAGEEDDASLEMAGADDFSGEIEASLEGPKDEGEEFNLDNDEGEREESSSEGDFDGFSEENDSAIDGGFEDDSDGETKIVTSFVEFELDISGEDTNFDKYYIRSGEVFIGRDPNKCQIILDDPEASQVHAVVKRKGTHCELEDLNSTNGVILNGSRVNQSRLSHNDEFLIGSTSFRLIVKSDLIRSEESGLMPIQEIEEVEVEEVIEEEVEVSADGEGGDLLLEGTASDSQMSNLGGTQRRSLFSAEALSDPEKRKKLLIFAVVGIGLWIFLGEEGEQKQTDKKAKSTQSKKASSGVDTEKNKEDLASEDKKSEENKKEVATPPPDPNRKYENLPEDLQEYVRTNYELAKTEILDYGHFERGLQYLNKINEYVDEFEQSKSLEITAKEEFKKLEEIEREKRLKQEQEEKKIRVGNLLEKANEAFEKEQMELVQGLLNKVAEIDPENLDASQLKLQLDAFIKEKERLALEEAQKKAERERLERALRPGKKLYLKESWYRAIIALEKFLAIKENDNDLVAEATKMLKGAQANLKNQTLPLLQKAQSLDEGQDLKGAYETYKKILKINPAHTDAVIKMDKIKGRIDMRAKRIYREAIVDESLNYLKKAKEKFQEVQQISPTDSPYHKRAENKLKNYTDH